MYSGYGIAFERAGSWSFGNAFAWNIVIFDVGNSSSSHIDNRKNNFSALGERPADDIKGSIGAVGQKFVINFIKAKANFCLSLH